MSDGDLWFHFEEAAKAKGPKAIRISKVKGHVTQAQVDDGTFRAVDKSGNDQADHAADVAVQMHGEEIVSLAKILHRRHRQYFKFMQHVVKHIIEGYLIHRKLTDVVKSKQDESPSKIDFQPLQVQTQGNTSNAIKTFKLQGDVARYKSFQCKHRASGNVWHFINGLQYTESTHQYNATTWLELCIMFRCLGYPKPILDNPSAVRMQLRAFKSIVRGIVQRGFYDTEQSEMFRPAEVTLRSTCTLALRGSNLQ